jgi:hypothetical protein
MATITIEKPVESGKYDDIRRLVDGPDTIKRGFLGELAGGLSRWADRYAAYKLEAPYWDDVRF